MPRMFDDAFTYEGRSFGFKFTPLRAGKTGYEVFDCDDRHRDGTYERVAFGVAKGGVGVAAAAARTDARTITNSTK